VPRLYRVATQDDFDALHSEICRQILNGFKTNRGQTLAYGQAQKPVNVFFKVYVDWAAQPQPDLAKKLASLLHVPLDSLLMTYMKREFPILYDEKIGQIRRRNLDRTTERLRGVPEARTVARTMARSLIGSEFSLSAINQETYLAWQAFLRSLYPAKPVMLDVVWVLERKQPRIDAST